MVWFAALVLLLLALIATCVFLTMLPSDRKERKQWAKWYGLALVLYVLLSVPILLIVARMQARDQNVAEAREFLALSNRAKQEAGCKPARTACLEQAIHEKKLHDSTRRPIAELEAAVQADPLNAALQAELSSTKEAVARDVQRISACDKEPQTNACIEATLDRCDQMMQKRARNDPTILTQFREFRKTAPASDVARVCTNAAEAALR